VLHKSVYRITENGQSFSLPPDQTPTEPQNVTQQSGNRNSTETPTEPQNVTQQSGARNSTETATNGESGVSVFEQFGNDSPLPLALGGGSALGIGGLGAYRWLSGDDEEGDNE